MQLKQKQLSRPAVRAPPPGDSAPTPIPALAACTQKSAQSKPEHVAVPPNIAENQITALPPLPYSKAQLAIIKDLIAIISTR
jgi:hypothetical protein